MLSPLYKRVAIATLLSLLFVFPLFASVDTGFVYEGDSILTDKTIGKMKEMGDELYKKTGVTTVLVAKKHLSKAEFLEIKDRYLKELKPPYVLWIFSKTYMDRKEIGINQMFNSPDLNGKFDKDSLFSPFSGTFTKLIVIQKSKVDPTSAAFLNGYADLVDMIASSYGVKLKSSLGNESRTFMDWVRVIFYLTLLYFLWLIVRKRFIKKGNSIEKTE